MLLSRCNLAQAECLYAIKSTKYQTNAVMVLEATYLLLPPDEKLRLSAKQVLDFHKENIFFKGNLST